VEDPEERLRVVARRLAARLQIALRQFRTAVIDHSPALVTSQMDEWLEGYWNRVSGLRGEASSASAGLVLPQHSGPREPLDFQEEIIAEVSRRMTSESRFLMTLPTGAGKTYTATRLLLGQLAAGTIRSFLWLAPQKILVAQARGELAREWWFTSQANSLLLSEWDEESSPSETEGCLAAFATIQSGDVDPEAYWQPDAVVVDEAHHLQSNTWGAWVERIGKSAKLLLGLTATPGRCIESECAGLSSIFHDNLVYPGILGGTPIAELMARGVYSEIDTVRLSPSYLTVDDRARRSSLSPSVAALIPGRLDAIVEAVVARPEDSVLVFCNSIAHSHVVAAALHAAGVSVEVVSSDVPTAVNAKFIQQFRGGAVQCLVNAKYLTTGVDMPTATAAILAVPIGSPIVYEQIVGRISRGETMDGTPAATVLEFDDHNAKHGGVMGYARFAEHWGIA
jgi:DNA repair protein RadD